MKQIKQVILKLTEQENEQLMEKYIEYLKNDPLCSKNEWIKKVLGVK